MTNHKTMLHLRALSCLAVLLLACLFGLPAAYAQTAQFTYQGKLVDNGAPASGTYDLEFRLFDAPAGGVQQGSSITADDVVVSSGIFTVSLDFGAAVFPGASRWLEISVRPGASTGEFTLLTPRQPVTSTPYAVRSLNAATAVLADGLSAACVGCVTSAQISSVNGSAVNGAIPVAAVPAGSASYLQNTTTAQTATNFNISGNGTAGGTLAGNIVNAATQYNIGGSRVLSVAGTNNTFVGQATGSSNTTGGDNAFFGTAAGFNNTTGSNNVFFGRFAGFNNISGNDNVFVGRSAGSNNSSGDSNSFFGRSAGASNTTGGGNSFFGSSAGLANTTAGGNAFFGYQAGMTNTTGFSNSFFGSGAGSDDSIGFQNAFFGAAAGRHNTSGNNNSFFGFRAGDANTTADFNSFFGTFAGFVNTTGTENSFFGESAGEANTEGSQNSFFGRNAGVANTTGDSNTFIGVSTGLVNTTGTANTFVGRQAGLSNTAGVGNSFFGTTAGHSSLGSTNSFFGSSTGGLNTTGSGNSFFGSGAGLFNTTGDHNTILGFSADVGSGNLSFATAIGADAVVSASNTIVLGRDNGQDEVVIPGVLFLGTLGGAGATHVCINAFTHLSTCSSSRRYKESVVDFKPGLQLLSRLRPVAFAWKTDHARDLGLIAEEVAEVEPLLVTHNKTGAIEGVKYDQLAVVLINAVKEQQKQIETLQQRNAALSARLISVEKTLKKRVGSARRRLRPPTVKTGSYRTKK